MGIYIKFMIKDSLATLSFQWSTQKIVFKFLLYVTTIYVIFGRYTGDPTKNIKVVRDNIIIFIYVGQLAGKHVNKPQNMTDSNLRKTQNKFIHVLFSSGNTYEHFNNDSWMCLFRKKRVSFNDDLVTDLY